MKTVGTTLKAQGKPVNEAGERAKKKLTKNFIRVLGIMK